MDNLSLTLYAITSPPAGITNLGSASTSGTPGCTRVTQVLATSETIDNLNRSYALEIVSGRGPRRASASSPPASSTPSR